MKKPADGGTAFPMQDPQTIHSYAAGRVAGITDADERDRTYMTARAEAVGGMTLRDYFAAKAMQAIIGKKPLGTIGAYDAHPAYREAALGAYDYADAMLAARAGAQP